MNIRLLNLTQEESDILSYVATDFVKEYTEGVCYNHKNLFEQFQIEGYTFNKIKSEKDMRAALDCKQAGFVKKHGDSALTEGVIKLICQAAYLRDIESYKNNSTSGDADTQSSQGVLRLSNPQGQIRLFDSPLEVSQCVEFQLCKARISRRGSEDVFSIHAGARKLDFRLSPEQFIRFMRSESMMIPCTISCINGDMFDPPLPDYDTHNKINSSLESEIAKQVKPLKEAQEDLLSFIKANMPFTSKKMLKELNDKFLAFERIYNEIKININNKKTSSAQDITEEFKKSLIKIASVEMERLPDHLKNKLYIPNIK